MNITEKEFRTYDTSVPIGFGVNYVDDNLNIVDLLSEFNYNKVIDKHSNGNGSWNKYEKENIEFLVNEKHNFWKNVHDDSPGNKGKSFRFIMAHLKGSFEPLNSYTGKDTRLALITAHKFLHLENFQNQNRSQTVVKSNKQKKEAIYKNIEILPLIDTSYLTKNRHISSDTIEHTIFKNKILNNKFTILKNNRGKITNTIFPLVKPNDINKTIGYVSRNKPRLNKKNQWQRNDYFNPVILKNNDKYKILDEDFAEGLWISNKPENLKHIIISESEIDALSHFEIKKPKDALYISFGGNLTPGKAENLYKFIDNFYKENKKLNIISITDNDISGFYYDINIIKHFVNKSNQIDFQANTNKEKINISFNSKDLKRDLSILKENQKLNSIEIFPKNNRINIIVYKEKTTNKEIKSLLKNIADNYSNTKIYLNKPTYKDWNEELKKKKFVDKKLILKTPILKEILPANNKYKVIRYNEKKNISYMIQKKHNVLGWRRLGASKIHPKTIFEDKNKAIELFNKLNDTKKQQIKI